MKVFVTGGTGFIGKPLVRSLLRRGWQVTALVRRPDSPDARRIEGMGARLCPGDITDPAAVREAVRGADMVVHNAGWYTFGVGGKMKDHMRRVNLEGTENVLAAAAEAGAGRIVHVSSIVAHGPTGPDTVDETYERRVPPATTYEATKAEAHEAARRFQAQGAPVVIASPGGVIGPGDHTTLGYYARLYVRGMCIPLMAKGKRSTVYVDDCAEGIALAAEKGRPGEEYILSGGVQTYPEMFAVWKRVKGGPRFMIWLPRGIGDVMTWSMEPLQRLLRLPPVITREVFLTGTVHWCYSGAKAERELGAQMRDPTQAWLDTLEIEHSRAAAGKSWRDLDG